MFKRCCGNRKEIDYKIEHSPRPIKLSDDMDKVIKNYFGILRILIHTNQIKMN